MIYLIKCSETNTCKIGYSINPDSRLFQLQTGNPFLLELLRVIEGTIEDEKILHNKFKDFKMKGEWFEYVNEIKDYFEIEDYLYVNSNYLKYVNKHFSHTEVGRITAMANMVAGCFNILHTKEQEPHTDETLMQEIAYTRNRYAEFIKKLYNKGIIYYVTDKKQNKPVKYILLNPHLAKKSKTIHKECLTYFDPLQ